MDEQEIDTQVAKFAEILDSSPSNYDGPRFIYGFNHGTKVKQFGPYASESAARAVFMWVYGYHPGPAVSKVPYNSPDTD